MKRKYISNMPIEGFSKYHICKNGRLYSIHSGTWRLIKPVAKSTGYISNNLISDSGKRANFYRHRLVAEVYLPNDNHTLVVCHKDNNPLNNRVSNLYWGTPRDNTQQCIRDGRFKPRGKTPLSIEIRRKIKAEYLKGNTTLQKLSRKYGRAHSVIRRIVYETK